MSVGTMKMVGFSRCSLADHKKRLCPPTPTFTPTPLILRSANPSFLFKLEFSMTIHFGTDGWRAVISDDLYNLPTCACSARPSPMRVASESWDKSVKGGQAPTRKNFVVGFRYALPLRPLRRSVARSGCQCLSSTWLSPTRPPPPSLMQ